MVKVDKGAVKDMPDEETMMRTVLDEEAKVIALKHKPSMEDLRDLNHNGIPDDEEVPDDSIFDWERHLDEKSGRAFYYNAKTKQSSWTPPTVKIDKTRDRASQRRAEEPIPATVFMPKPPVEPRLAFLRADSADFDLDEYRRRKA